MTDQPTPRPADAAAAGEAGEPQGAAMTADEMVAAWRELMRKAVPITTDLHPFLDSRVGFRIGRNAVFGGYSTDPLCAFSQAYRAYRKAQEQKP